MELHWLVQMLITQNHHLKEVSSNTQSSNTNVQAVSAPTSSESRSYSTSTTSYSAPSHNYSSHSSSVRLSNGNTAGSVGSYAAALKWLHVLVYLLQHGNTLLLENQMVNYMHVMLQVQLDYSKLWGFNWFSK